MGRLIYSAITSLDGFVADAEGGFDWAMPDPEVHQFINDLERDVGTYLLGRRMWETMQVWESPSMSTNVPAYIADYAGIWRAADKVIYSSTLPAPSIDRTRVERHFDPASVREMKERSARDLSIGGPTLAAPAFRAGLVDECRLFETPVVVGAGLSAFPVMSLALTLIDERRFGNGMVYLRYAVESPERDTP